MDLDNSVAMWWLWGGGRRKRVWEKMVMEENTIQEKKEHLSKNYHVYQLNTLSIYKFRRRKPSTLSVNQVTPGCRTKALNTHWLQISFLEHQIHEPPLDCPGWVWTLFFLLYLAPSPPKWNPQKSWNNKQSYRGKCEQNFLKCSKHITLVQRMFL